MAVTKNITCRDLNDSVIDLIGQVNKYYSKEPEYKTMLIHLISLAKLFNIMCIREVTNELVRDQSSADNK
jgi:hypothetical protein